MAKRQGAGFPFSGKCSFRHGLLQSQGLTGAAVGWQGSTERFGSCFEL